MKFAAATFVAACIAIAVAAPKHPRDLQASAVLLPDYQWHVVADGGVRLNGKGFCFDELLGPDRMPETCGPRESLLAWRVVR